MENSCWKNSLICICWMSRNTAIWVFEKCFWCWNIIQGLYCYLQLMFTMANGMSSSSSGKRRSITASSRRQKANSLGRIPAAHLRDRLQLYLQTVINIHNFPYFVGREMNWTIKHPTAKKIFHINKMKVYVFVKWGAF